MSVDWNWKDKKGEIVWRNKVGKQDVFKWTMYHANCLGCCLYEYVNKDTNEDMYSFQCFFNDVHHLKRILGLEKLYHEEGKRNLFEEWYGDQEISYIWLDPTYPYWDKLAKYFIQAGYEVRIHKGEEESEQETI